MATPPNIAERGMAVGLRALNRVASSGAIDRLGLRDPVTNLIHGATRTGARTAATASAWEWTLMGCTERNSSEA